MPLYFWDNSYVLINGSGFMSSNASVDTRNSVIPLFAVGRRLDIGKHPAGPLNSEFKFNYYPELGNDPNIGIINTCKNLTNDVLWSGVTGTVGGVTGYRLFPTNFNIRSEPNEIVQASITYQSFEQLSGSLQNKPNAITFDPSGLTLHGWTTYIVARSGYLVNPTYSFEYDISFDWQPIYILGQKFPYEVHLIGWKERLGFTKDIWHNNVTFSGMEPHQSGFTFTGNDSTVDVMAYKLICENPEASGNEFAFQISGGRILSSRTEARVDDFVKVIYNIENYF